MRRPVAPRLRWDGSSQAHPRTLGESLELLAPQVEEFARATARSFEEAMANVAAVLAADPQPYLDAYRDLLASTRPETRREKVQFAFWDRWIAVKYGVPWAGHWPDAFLLLAAVMLFLAFASLAAWPYPNDP